MELHIFIILLCVYFNGIRGQEKTHYSAAVVDFASQPYHDKIPALRLVANFKEYEKFIIEASSKKVDIIVFPECGLTSISLPQTVKELTAYAMELPNPLINKTNPCDDDQHKNENVKGHTFLKRLSCSAKENNIYLVINLPERVANMSSNVDDNDSIYNTNIVFDRKGNLIARYRKYNLFGERGFSRTPKPELIKFKTDFGVTFGTFICFDIMFKTPALELLAKNEDVTDIVYPTAWFSELPFLTAIQTQAGWAKANGVNLLSAGYNNPDGGSGGSGIFPINGNIKYIMPVKHESTMVIHEVPIIKKRQVMPVEQQKPISINPISVGSGSGMKLLREKLEIYTTQLVNQSISDHRLCHNDFCCIFDLEFTTSETVDYYYRMIVFDGTRIFGILEHEAQICGIAACTNKTIGSCGQRLTQPKNPSIKFDRISIKGDMFNQLNSTFIPSYTDYNLSTSYNYFYNTSTKDELHLQTIEMKNLEPIENLLGFGIYGTVFNTSSIVSFSYMNSLYLLIAVFLFTKMIY